MGTGMAGASVPPSTRKILPVTQAEAGRYRARAPSCPGHLSCVSIKPDYSHVSHVGLHLHGWRKKYVLVLSGNTLKLFRVPEGVVLSKAYTVKADCIRLFNQPLERQGAVPTAVGGMDVKV